MEKIKMKREHTRSTFVMEGRDARRAFTTRRIPSFLLITLRGLNPLNDLKDFKA